MIKVKDLIGRLQKIEDHETEIDITYDPINEEPVLYYVPDPSKPDSIEKIRME